MERKNIKVVWLCHLSNSQIREHLYFKKFDILRFIHKMKGMTDYKVLDYAKWNTNAILEFEHFDDIDLTIIFPHRGLRNKLQRFVMNGVTYICFRPEGEGGFAKLKKRIIRNNTPKYIKNRKTISKCISEIQPNIVHIIGAENPYYSLATLDIPITTPCIVSLQTLVNEPNFDKRYPIDPQRYKYIIDCERKIIKRSNYIFTGVPAYISIIRNTIAPNAIMLRMPLAVGMKIDLSTSSKEYDFVYFANNINKACDHAIEAFAIAHKKYPQLTMNVSGGYSHEYKAILDNRIHDLGIEDYVFFTGLKATHREVIEQIKKSHFAILPLKVDICPSTVREAMACGLPVVTTETVVTSKLSKEKNCLLVSSVGDFDAMANNMIKLIENEDLANTIRENAFSHIRLMNNEHFMNMWRKAYYEIIQNFNYDTPFSDDVIYS